MRQENLRSPRIMLLTALLVGAAAFAWLGLIRSAKGMQMPNVAAFSAAGMLAFTLEWGVMMTAMMLPAATPMILLYATATKRSGAPGANVAAGEVFAMTYAVLWLLTGVPVYLASTAIRNASVSSPSFAAALPYAIGGTLIAAGIYQLSPAKHACLRQCQSPVDFLMRRWRAGYVASLQLAAAHAAYCVGCCWALMVVLVVAGAMSLPWVLAIALVVFAEKVLPQGARTARIIGVVLVIAGAAVTIWPVLAGTFRPV